jgi:hypothetical protein
MIYTADWPELKLLTLTYGSVKSSKYCHRCLCNTRTSAHVWTDECAERTIEGTRKIISRARELIAVRNTVLLLLVPACRKPSVYPRLFTPDSQGGQARAGLQLLKEYSLVNLDNAFWLLAGLEFHISFVNDKLHQTDLGSGKAAILNFCRVLGEQHEVGTELNCRFFESEAAAPTAVLLVVYL